jgi:hypothetical protein
MKTLEEAAERNYNEQKLNTYTPYSFNDAFKDGAKWQAERMYSQEEVVDLIEDWTKMAKGLNMNFPSDKFEEWFKQFERE